MMRHMAEKRWLWSGVEEVGEPVTMMFGQTAFYEFRCVLCAFSRFCFTFFSRRGKLCILLPHIPREGWAVDLLFRALAFWGDAIGCFV